MRIREIHQTLLKLSRGKQVHWFLQRKTGYLLRLTNNYIHQGGYQDKTSVSIRVIENGCFGLSETSDMSREGIANAIHVAERNVGATHWVARSEQGRVMTHERRSGRPSGSPLQSAESAAQKMKQALECVKQLGAHAHGYFSDNQWQSLVGNSQGLFLEHHSTGARFGLTVNRGIGSGYQTFFHPDSSQINFVEVTEEALKHACLTERPVSLKPGRYTVILAPRALAAFLSGFLEEWNGLRFHEKESFLIHHKNRPVASSAWTITDDIFHPLQTGAPFDTEGDPKKKVTLLKGGRLGSCVYDRWTAKRFRVKTTGHSVNLSGEEGALPFNTVIAGGKSPRLDMIKEIQRGILIPNIWYHQIADPSHWMVTGLTRGGAAWIENGKIAGGLGRIRYLDGLLGALKRTSQMSREQYALKVRDQGSLVLPYVQIEDLRIV